MQILSALLPDAIGIFVHQLYSVKKGGWTGLQGVRYTLSRRTLDVSVNSGRVLSLPSFCYFFCEEKGTTLLSLRTQDFDKESYKVLSVQPF